MHLFLVNSMSALILPVTQEMLVREVPVRVFERGLQDVAVASVLLLNGILLLYILDFTQD